MVKKIEYSIFPRNVKNSLGLLAIVVKIARIDWYHWGGYLDNA